MREEIGFADMDKYEFGGLEIDKTLGNGYLLYVPYGIHKDIFDAIEHSIRAFGNQKDSLEETKRVVSMNDRIDEKTKNSVIEDLDRQVNNVEKDIKILETILPISNEI